VEQTDNATEGAGRLVRHFRQILVWPLQLVPIREGSQIQKHWEVLERAGPDNPWREVADEITGDPAQFQERHYSEFVTFLPHVQRFLYGEGRPGRAGVDSPIRVFRRQDIARVRMRHRPDSPPAEFRVAHIDLYFFYDIDIVVLAFEIFADDIDLRLAQHTLYRFGRAYPPHWEPDGTGTHCLARAEWLGVQGAVLAVSDFEKRDKYLSFVCRHRSPCIASHWEALLAPLVLDRSSAPGQIRYRLVEYYRMPVLAYLALDDPRALTRADFVGLGLVAAPAGEGALPYSERYLFDFEQRVCYDRYWSAQPGGPSTRFMSCGHALVVVGSRQQPLFTDPETGVLGQFRHQHFLLFLIAHFHKAALLMLSDRLVVALNKLDILEPESVRQFKRTIRQVFEIFLRFTHRYWFHEVSDQAQVKELFRMCAEHLGTDRLYSEVRQEIEDMADYLDSDSLRRQANTVVRLTVVTTFGLIATVSTGFLGMNLIAEADASLGVKLLYFGLVFLPTAALTLYAVLKSKRLSDFLEALSDERMPGRAKLASLLDVWRPLSKRQRPD
jgi:hypothetical protein